MKANNEKMLSTLKELGFIDNSGEEFFAFYKLYKGFRLWIATKKDGADNNWIASLSVGSKMEISIPLTVNEFWVYGFNEENN